jgi:lipoprotein NlpI
LNTLHAAVKMAPNAPEAHNNLGLALLEAGSPQQAAESFRRCLALQPDYAAAHYNLGLALQRSGHAALAENELKKAKALGLELPPEN